MNQPSFQPAGIIIPLLKRKIADIKVKLEERSKKQVTKTEDSFAQINKFTARQFLCPKWLQKKKHRKSILNFPFSFCFYLRDTCSQVNCSTSAAKASVPREILRSSTWKEEKPSFTSLEITLRSKYQEMARTIHDLDHS